MVAVAAVDHRVDRDGVSTQNLPGVYSRLSGMLA
jgi:hypothetical protein